jgi:hypothetical protein
MEETDNIDQDHHHHLYTGPGQYYCPSDKSLELNTILITYDSFIIIGNFKNSIQSQSWVMTKVERR